MQEIKVLSANGLEEMDGYESTMVGHKPGKKKGVQKYRDVVKKATKRAVFIL